MPTESGEGFADYVLYGDDGKPLAVIEAKKTAKDARVGAEQARMYATCLEKETGVRPVIFFTNGGETWIWDDAQGYPAGPSKAELKTIVSAIVTALPKWKEHLVKRVSEEKLEAFSMHFLFVPFPSADNFRKLFRDHLGLTTPLEDAAPQAPEPPGSPPLIPTAAKGATAKSGRARTATPPASRRVTTAKVKRGSPRGAS
jgi:hypothetical protein